MKAKRLLSLFIALILCVSSFTAFAEEAEEIVIAPEEVVEEVVVPTEETADDPTEEIVAMPEGDGDERVDYADKSNWAYWNEGGEKPADLFFICPTVDMGDAGNYIADINGEKYRRYFVGATCQELGIYSDVSTVYAPYYRQVTFPVYSLAEEDREVYLDFAYQDIKDAFIYYAENTDPSRPLILAGFSQGADLTIRLMKDLFDEPKYQRRLVAAYAIGWKLTEDEVLEYPHLKPAEGETDTGVIVAFNSEAEDVTYSVIIGENEKTYAINPLNWKTTSEMADKSLNKGACFTDYSGNIKEEIPQLTGAYIDEKRGALKTPDVDKATFSSSMFNEGVYHLYDYQFFFRNLQENVKARLDAYNEKYADRLDVFYNDDIMCYDVEPIIENGRTLVPFRAIFEAMGCAVNYTVADGKQIVSARRGEDSLILTIGESKMYFNGEEIALDVPGKIKDSRTLVPLRAVSEAFECEVLWYGDTRTIRIYSPAESYVIGVGRIAETVTDDNGRTLIEAVAYYPIIDNPVGVPEIDVFNEDYKWYAEKFVEEAVGKRADAEMLREQMGDAFTPFTFEQTFVKNYNITSTLSITTYKYVNQGGAHPTIEEESRTFNLSDGEEIPLSKMISFNAEEGTAGETESIISSISKLFAEKLLELGAEEDYDAAFALAYDNIAYLQYHLNTKGLVMYYNRGVLAPYALGVVSVEVPYNPVTFYVDMRNNLLDEYVFELEYDKDYIWNVLYSEEKLEIVEEVTAYAPEEILSEYYPVGMNKITIKGIEKGNAGVVLAHSKVGEGLESSTRIIIASFYVDENNKITLVMEDDGMFLLN